MSSSVISSKSQSRKSLNYALEVDLMYWKSVHLKDMESSLENRTLNSNNSTILVHLCLKFDEVEDFRNKTYLFY